MKKTQGGFGLPAFFGRAKRSPAFSGQRKLGSAPMLDSKFLRTICKIAGTLLTLTSLWLTACFGLSISIGMMLGLAVIAFMSAYLPAILIELSNTSFKTEFRVGIDRKSTRLNSSHVKNSYAVFCLKNKNMSRRLRLIVWAAIAVLIWNVIFDLHITRCVRYVLHATAEAELGWGPSVAICDVRRTTV